MKKILCVLALVCSVFLIEVSHADTSAGFDDKDSYDIYFNAEGGKILFIRNVSIVGIKQIGEKIFLLVENSQFKMSDSNGFIALDSIAGIFPINAFQVRSE